MVYAFILKTAAMVLTLVASAHAKPGETVMLTHPDGSTAEVALFGAHVLSFRAAMNPKLDILFLSKESYMDCVKPIRGGIPIIFPNFGSYPGLPGHGFARITNWTLISKANSTGEKNVPTVATFAMESSNKTRAIWPFDFKLKYVVELYANHLTTALHVTNTFTKQILFHVLLHNYLWVEDVRNKGAQVFGLKGVNYFDKVANVNKTETREYIEIDAEIDNVYRNAPNEVKTIIKGINTANRTVTVKKAAFIDGTKGAETETKTKSDFVVWNPWDKRAKTMPDFGDEEYKNMVAIEPGRVSEMQPLPAGKTYTFQQTISVSTV